MASHVIDSHKTFTMQKSLSISSHNRWLPRFFGLYVTQDERIVYNLTTSDKFETNRYSGLGVDETNYKPLSWTKQKTDRKINGQYVYKSRDVLEPLILTALLRNLCVASIDKRVPFAF